jgi:hypothetical protein
MKRVSLTAFVYDNPVLFAFWTVGNSKTALSAEAKFNECSFFHQLR